MLKSHEKFHSKDGKRLILIVDDEMINREILGNILQNEYDLLFAKDGKEALDQIRENKDYLSLILLDLLMSYSGYGDDVRKGCRGRKP